MFFLVYVSAAVTWFSTRDLEGLLARSRARNAVAGITGLLPYKDGNFMQVIEGDEAAVRALATRIAGDLRHHGMVTLCTGHTECRQFADWRMAFVDLGADPEGLPAGYSDFLDTPLTEAALARGTSRCLDLLNVFKQIG